MRLSFSSLIVPVYLMANVMGQGTFIASPLSGENIANGANFTVQITRPRSHQGSIEVGFAIGLIPCGTASCPTASEALGRLLYNGPYQPHLQDISGPPYQNFTFTMAPEFPKGIAQLSTVRLHLMGPDLYSILETQSVSIQVV